MRGVVFALICIITASMVSVTLYMDDQLRTISTTQIADILSHPSAYNNSIIQLQGRLEPYSPEPWSSRPIRYGLLKDRTGAIVLLFPDESPTSYIYGELNITGRVRYIPRTYIPGLWLYVEVSSYEGREAALRIKLSRMGGIAGLKEQFIVEPDGSGRYSSDTHGENVFTLSTGQLYQLKASVIGHDFLDIQPEEFNAKQGAADYFTHSLTITFFYGSREAERKTVSWVDDWALKEPLPENLRQIRGELEGLIREILDAMTIDEGEAVKIATSFVKGTTTFTFDGIEGSLKVAGVTKVVNEPPTSGLLWIVEVAFLTGHPGHGNRSGLILIQVVTEHRAVVMLDEGGGIIRAICDDNWDLITDRELETPSSKPIKFTIIVNEAMKLGVYIDVDLTDGVEESEANMIAETTFTSVMGEKVLRKLERIGREGDLLKANYTWGYGLEDMGHVYNMTADLSSRMVIVTHCR